MGTFLLLLGANWLPFCMSAGGQPGGGGVGGRVGAQPEISNFLFLIINLLLLWFLLSVFKFFKNCVFKLLLFASCIYVGNL